jgi:hypothetical protein
LSASDPVELFFPLETPVPPRPAFADALYERLRHELERPQPRVFPRRSARTFAIAVALLLLLAGVATATYVVARVVAGGSAPPAGTLTLVSGKPNGAATIAAVGPHGRLRTVWECPAKVFCGDLTSIAWSRDGRRVAFTLDELGGASSYVGLHIVDVRTGRDLHVGGVPLKHPYAVVQPMSVLVAQGRLTKRRIGCRLPTHLAWSPDSRRLAYSCGTIFTIRADGTHRVRIPTGSATSTAPSWSPNGNRIAFATGVRRLGRVRSSVYIVNADGTGRRLLSRDAASPSWSWDGSLIAYDSTDGVRLITPDGVRKPAIGPKGPPSFSPDAAQIAIATPKGVVVVDSGTLQGSLVTPESGTGIFGQAIPAWYPGDRAWNVPPPRRRPAGCAPC